MIVDRESPTHRFCSPRCRRIRREHGMGHPPHEGECGLVTHGSEVPPTKCCTCGKQGLSKRIPRNLRAAAPDLLRACEAWATNGWCVEGPRPRPDCRCDWHLAREAVAKAYERPAVKALQTKA